jgi:hypothetical protein
MNTSLKTTPKYNSCNNTAIDRFLKTLYTRFAGSRDATTEQFLKEAENQLGSEAKVFFNNALYQKRWIDPQKLP